MKKASFTLPLALFAGCISSKGQALSSSGEDNRILNPDQYQYGIQFLGKRELKVRGKLAGDSWLQLAENALRRNSSEEGLRRDLFHTFILEGQDFCSVQGRGC